MKRWDVQGFDLTASGVFCELPPSGASAEVATAEVAAEETAEEARSFCVCLVFFQNGCPRECVFSVICRYFLSNFRYLPRDKDISDICLEAIYLQVSPIRILGLEKKQQIQGSREKNKKNKKTTKKQKKTQKPKKTKKTKKTKNKKNKKNKKTNYPEVLGLGVV